MGSFRQMFATDAASEKDGVWLKYGEDKKLLCARAGGENKLFERTMERVSKPYRRVILAQALPTEDARRMLIEVFSLAIVRDWKGVTQDDLDGSGDMTEVPFTPENCQKLFTALPGIFDDVRESVTDIAAYRAYLDKEDSGN